MCGRATLSTPPEDLRELFELDEMPPLIPRYNIAPTQPIAVIRQPHRLELLRWGLIPAGTTDQAKAPRGINVRVETVARVPAYRSSLRARRCLVIVDGFFEWQRSGKLKKPFLIQRPDRKPFALAGIWDRFVTADGEVVESCAIITRDAPQPIAWLHDRMPLILPPEQWAPWLDSKNREAEALLHPEAPEGLVIRGVSTLVNNPDNDDPRCIEPAPEGLLVGENRSLF
jgi:putative SOS response-associated peptidase YedK